MMAVHTWCLLLAWISTAHSASRGALCPLPLTPENGQIKYMDRYEGGIVAFGCDEGYWYTGTNPRNCQADGKWTGVKGSCLAIQCGNITNTTHGNIKYTGWGYNDEATVECDYGYAYSQPKYITRHCLETRKWSGVDGSCIEAKCPYPKKPEHVFFDIMSLSVDSLATISCEDGYTYSGNQTLICQNNEQWSSEIGTCQEIPACEEVPKVARGSISLTGLRYKDNVTVTCNWGNSLHGTDRITCLSDGTWSASPGKCTTSKDVYWMVTVIGVVIMIIVFVTLKYRKSLCPKCHHKPNMNSQNNMEIELSQYKQPLLKKTTTVSDQHFRLYLKEDSQAGSYNMLSVEYMALLSKMTEKIESTLRSQFGIDNGVFINCISQPKRVVIFKVQCDENGKDDIMKCKQLTSMDGKEMLQRLPETIDHITSSLVVKIMQSKHVPDKQMDRKIDLETQYVRLKMFPNINIKELRRDTIELPDKYKTDMQNRIDDYLTDEEVIKREDIEKFVVICGRAGIGKTTLVQRLLWRWAHGEWATHLKAIFLLNLRTLMAIDSKVSLLQIFSLYTTYGRIDHKLESSWITEDEHSIGIILDGIDEIDNFQHYWDNQEEGLKEKLEEKKSVLVWVFSLLKRKCLPKATLIVTARPCFRLSLLKGKATKTIELVGLTQERISGFVVKNVVQDRQKMVIQTLERSPILMSLCSITAYCATLCEMIEKDIGVTDKPTTYTQITAHLIQKLLYRSMKKSDWEEVTPNLSAVLKSLVQLAYSRHFTRTDKEVAQSVLGKDLTSKYVAVAEKMGFFHVTEKEDSSSENTRMLGQFVHLSIQEFLAMIGLLSQGDSDEVRQALPSLSMSGQFNMSLLFLYGLAFNTNDKQMRELYSMLGLDIEIQDDVRKVLTDNVMKISDSLQVLQIIHESQSPEFAQKVGNQKFSIIEFHNSKLTVVDVFALAFLLDHHHSVTSIDICDEGINDEGVRCIVQSLSDNKTLHHLGLTSNSVTEKGVGHLATFMQDYKSMQSLRLASDSISDEGVKIVVDSLKDNKALHTLGLKSQLMTDEGVEYLARWLRDIRTLEVFGFDVRDRSAKALLKALASSKGSKVIIEKSHCSQDIQKQLRDTKGFTFNW